LSGLRGEIGFLFHEHGIILKFIANGESELIVLCNHGYSSIFSAATLVDLGFTRAGDVVGGFRAWRAAGLPVTTAPSERRGADELAGMSSPDAG